MPKQPIAVELEAINREGEIQTVYGSDTVGPAYELAERLSLALAIPLTVRVPTDLMPSSKLTPPTTTASAYQ